NPVTVECFGDIPAPNTNLVTATDNCSGSSMVSFVRDNYLTNGSVITVTRTYSASDACGNRGTATHSIYVHDTTAPIVKHKDITVSLDPTGHASITASQIDNGSSDACSSVTLAIDKSTFDCSNLGTNTVKLTVTDASGNSASCNATVTVQDKLAPI